CALAIAMAPAQLHAQLVREDSVAPRPQSSATPAPATTPAQTPSGKRRLSQEVQITGDQLWLDTGIDVKPGEHMIITATGNLRYADAQAENGPDGLPRGFKDLLRILPFANGGRGALIGRIGDETTGQAFLIGAHQDVISPVGGRLWVGINQMQNDLGEGTYKVHV